MLKFLKKPNPYAGAARHLYAQALECVRRPAFYESMGVPDSFDGRYDLLLVHLYLVIERMLPEQDVGQEFNQALFDVTFADMDQTLREMGIGDMGVPKHMRRMMKAFNGRMHAYQEAHEQGKSAFEQALSKNLYGTLERVDEAHMADMMRYIEQARSSLNGQGAADILEVGAEFMEAS